MVAAKVCESVCVLTDGAEDAVELLTENVKVNGLSERGTTFLSEKIRFLIFSPALTGFNV
jgi:tRNA G37 N-methylase Trm5